MKHDGIVSIQTPKIKFTEKYFVNATKRVVVCKMTMHCHFDNIIMSIDNIVGKAKCSDVDEFNEVIGKKLSGGRARNKAYKIINEDILKAQIKFDKIATYFEDKLDYNFIKLKELEEELT